MYLNHGASSNVQINEHPIFYVDNDEYIWLQIWASNINQIKRPTLEYCAFKYGIYCTNYKNKKLIINKLISLWKERFIEYPEFERQWKQNFIGNVE